MIKFTANGKAGRKLIGIGLKGWQACPYPSGGTGAAMGGGYYDHIRRDGAVAGGGVERTDHARD